MIRTVGLERNSPRQIGIYQLLLFCQSEPADNPTMDCQQKLNKAVIIILIGTRYLNSYKMVDSVANTLSCSTICYIFADIPLTKFAISHPVKSILNIFIYLKCPFYSRLFVCIVVGSGIESRSFVFSRSIIKPFCLPF